MNCAEVEKGEYTARYVLGELTEGEARELEEHFLTCTGCFEALKDLSALRSELSEDRWAVQDRHAPTRPRWRWAWAAAVAVVIVGIGVVLLTLPRKSSDAVRLDIPGLAAIEAPPYVPGRLRSTGDEAERLFRDAMALYREGDYAEAIPGLREALSRDPRMPSAGFFLGICYLMTDRPDAAIVSLRDTVALGDTLYLEEAHFYLGKAYLHQGDADAALTELNNAIRMQGDLADEASQLVRRVRDITAARD